MRRQRTSGSSGGDRRKTMQLCRQVERALHYALGDVGDDVLSGLYVVSVEPAPNASRLLVTVESMDEGHEMATVLQKLEFARPELRASIAEAIHRKRVPELVFSYRVAEPADEEGE